MRLDRRGLARVACLWRRFGLGMAMLYARFREMIAAAEHLVQGADGVKSRYLSTKTDVEQLLHGSWKGIAPATHGELWADWDDGFTLVQSALVEMAGKIAGAALTFHEVDENGA